MIYFSRILYFLDVIFLYKEIQIKYLFSNNQCNQFELTPALSSKTNFTVNHIKSHYLRKSRIARHSSKNRIFFYFAKTSLLVTLFKEK